MSKAAKRLVPLMNRVLIRKAEPVTQSKGGVLIPENSKARVSRGTVVAVGPGATTAQGRSVPCSVQVGDTVLLPDYGGTRIQYEGKEEYFIYREPDILAKINE